ncbi:MAG: hypothetical protein ABUK13_05605 [Gammaproteobacteria bacterium]
MFENLNIPETKCRLLTKEEVDLAIKEFVFNKYDETVIGEFEFSVEEDKVTGAMVEYSK